MPALILIIQFLMASLAYQKQIGRNNIEDNPTESELKKLVMQP